MFQGQPELNANIYGESVKSYHQNTYTSISFSDHYGHLAVVKVPFDQPRQAIPRAKRSLKIRKEVVDATFSFRKA